MDQFQRRSFNWRIVGECAASGMLCACIAAGVCGTLLPLLASAGIVKNWGLHPPPSGAINGRDLFRVSCLAVASAGAVLGPLLVLASNRPWASLLFGAFFPWVVMASGALLLTISPGPWYQGVVSSIGFLAAALTEWALCAALFFLLRGVRVFCAQPVL